ncbi:hypothetical protein glysoja_029226 [Glycine soja]|uniref:Uncharacterized protein n=1 Tax=Glycine soja TaxID=3848 RepID=A0A0B2SSE4_GLYSO|nr:hypothetical protein JHK87_021873 [Glycine soja]KHN47808.1 hypothetical protein glysoja_029226 [Glycine soja]
MLADIDRFLFENFKSLFLNDLEEPANRVEKSPELGPMPSGSSSATSESEIAEEQTVIPGNCVVVLANSVNPSKDFQRSMESVVEASGLGLHAGAFVLSHEPEQQEVVAQVNSQRLRRRCHRHAQPLGYCSGEASNG